jgi:hypothetical protein
MYIFLPWSEFKSRITDKGQVRYADKESFYSIFYQDGGGTFETSIWKDSGADQVEFEANYKAHGNKAVKQQVVTEPANLSITLYQASDIVEIAAGETANVDLLLTQAASETYQILYGGALYTQDSDFTDYVKFQVVDVNNVIGYGAGVVLKEYIKKAYLDSTGTFADYDEAGAAVPIGLVLRCIYVSGKTSGSSTKVKINYLLGIP